MPEPAAASPPADSARPLRELLHDVDVIDIVGDPSVLVDRITHDSRHCRPGTLFVAYRGVHRDVHAYIPDAVRRGAKAVLVERPIAELASEVTRAGGVCLAQVGNARSARSRAAAELFGHPSRHLTVVGVTGTDGKTTTCTLIHGLVTAWGRPAGLISTVGARTATETIATGLHTTTPEAEEIQALLADMVAAERRVAVLEVTSHGLAQYRVADVAFDVAAVTNVTREALEYHQTMEAYLAAKARLFELLSSSPPKPGVHKAAVLNVSDSSYQRLAGLSRVREITYGGVDPADFTATDIRQSRSGLTMVARTPAGDVPIRSPLLGTYNVANILAAMAVAHALGVPPGVWPAGVAATRGVPGRMELVDAGQPFVAIVDFAHTPNALHAALNTARQLTGAAGRVIVVFGCAGERDPGKRALMGAIAGRLADLTILTAEDPRHERLDDILAEIAVGLEDAGRQEGVDFWRVPDRYEAIRLAARAALRADVVIACGKGHEQSLCFGDTEYPWDDREALRSAIGDRPYGDLPTRAAR